MLPTPTQYNNRHLAEVICAFEFPFETVSWDNTLFGRFYDKISAQFPIRHTRKGVQIKFDTNISNPIDNRISSSPVEDQMLFQNDEKGWTILMGNKTLSFHITKNYPGWEAFMQTFVKPVLEFYTGIGLGNGDKTCGVVYLNHFPNLEGEPFEYFTITNKLEKVIGTETNSTIQRTFATENLSLIARIKCLKTVEGLNVNLECGCISNLSSNELIELAFLTRDPVKNFFESIATDKLKGTLL